MPSFSLASIPEIEGTIVIPENAVDVPVGISLKGAILFLPGQTQLRLKASHRRDNNFHDVTLQDDFAPAQSILADQLSLTQLTITLRFTTAAAPAEPVFDRAVQNAITVTGLVEWTGATALGFANSVRFAVGYKLSENESSGFTLTLIDRPLKLPGDLAQINSGLLGVEFPFNRPVFAVVLEGQAELTDEGKGPATQLLQTIFRPPTLTDPVGFRIRQEFGLTNGKVPTLPLPSGTPSFTIDLDWGGSAPPLTNSLPAAMRASIGPPSLTLPLGAGAQSTFKLRLPQSQIEFPNIEAFRGLRISGNFELETGPQSRLLFQPDMGGGFELPPVLDSLFDRLQWGGPVAAPDLPATAMRSVAEADWLGMFSSLLPPVPTAFNPAELSSQLFTLLSDALDTAGLETERVFGLALKGLAAGGRNAYAIAWENWFSPALAIPDAALKLPSIVLGMNSFADDAFRDAMKALITLPNATEQLVSNFFGEWVSKPDADFPRYQQAWARTLTALLPELSGVSLDRLVGSMLDAISLPEFQEIRTVDANAFAGLQAPRLPVGEMMMWAVLHALSAFSVSVGPKLDSTSLMKVWHKFWDNYPDDTPAKARERRQRHLRIATNQSEGTEVLLSLLLQVVRLNLTPWWPLLGETINDDTPGKNVKTFDPGKYLIVSDVHRDCAADYALPFDEKGGISHFRDNAELFLNILKWADAEGYTVLEAGDCEELWYIRDADTMMTPDAKGRKEIPKILAEIIKTHKALYEQMRKMWRDGKYYRLFGNHDSFLRDSDVFLVLKTWMETGQKRENRKEFEIYDYFVLKQVKSMTQHTLLSKLYDYLVNSVEPDRLLFEGTLGLDSNDYTDLCPMLIMHGHQFDFWNCDQNNILGLYLSQIGVKVDKAIDRILDARGIALGGNVSIDFGDFLAGLPIADCWPDEGAAVRLAHDVQHITNWRRGLVDGLFFKESSAAFIGSFGIATNHFDAQGNATTPSQTIGDGLLPRHPLEYLDKHHNHHICIGHTHNPHSQPFFTIGNLAGRIPVLGTIWSVIEWAADALPLVGRLLPRNLMKSKYFNSGTSGWMNGVVWAIHVDETKQARLVYWTKKTAIAPRKRPGDPFTLPEYMDWELTPLDPAVKAKMPQSIEDVERSLKQVLDDVMGIPSQLLKTVGATLSLPVELLRKVIALGAELGSELRSDLKEVVEAAPDAEEMFQQMQRDLLALLVALKAKLLRTRPDGEPEHFTFEINISPEVRDRLKERRDVIRNAAHDVKRPGESELNEFAALHVACIADPVIGTKMMPRTAPFFGKLRESIDGVRALAYDAPVLSGFASIVSLFPPDGLPPAKIRVRLDEPDQSVEPDPPDQPDPPQSYVLVSSKLSFTTNDAGLRLTVTFSNDPLERPLVA
jgi:hypothetical protein